MWHKIARHLVINFYVYKVMFLHISTPNILFCVRMSSMHAIYWLISMFSAPSVLC